MDAIEGCPKAAPERTLPARSTAMRQRSTTLTASGARLHSAEAKFNTQPACLALFLCLERFICRILDQVLLGQDTAFHPTGSKLINVGAKQELAEVSPHCKSGIRLIYLESAIWHAPWRAQNKVVW